MPDPMHGIPEGLKSAAGLKNQLCVFSLISILLFAPTRLAHPQGGDYQGADFIAEHGDQVWGRYYNINSFVIPTSYSLLVFPLGPSPGGKLIIEANVIEIRGNLVGKGAGLAGGGGGGGTHGTSGAFHDPDGIGGSGNHNCQIAQTIGHCYGAGPWAGFAAGEDGGYDSPSENNDRTTSFTVKMGSGAAGGIGGMGDVWGGGGGGGAGGSGGAAIYLIARERLVVTGVIDSSGTSGGGGGFGKPNRWDSFLNTYVGGAGGGGGGAIAYYDRGGSGGRSTSDDPATWGTDGGSGAGGGVLLYCENPNGLEIDGTIDVRGGREQMTNAGTVKIFFQGEKPTIDGVIHAARTYIADIDSLTEFGVAWMID